MTEADMLAVCEALSENFSARADAHDKAGTFPFENIEDLNRAGLIALTVPREYDGMGFGLLPTVRALEIIGRGDAGMALGCAMTWYAIGNLALQRVWDEAKFARLCRKIVADQAWVNNIVSEPEMGSPSRGGLPKTTATRVEGGYHINGFKSWCTWAPALTYFILWAQYEGKTALFCARRDAPGVTLLNNWGDALSLRTSGSCDIELKNVFVPEEWLVELREPHTTNTGSLPSAWSTLGFAATYLGIGEAALRALARYAHARVPTALNKPIAELPHIQRAIGQMDVTLRAARAVLHSAAHRWDEHPSARAHMAAELAATKYLCTNASVTCSDLAMRAAGAQGLDRRLPLERLLRDARAGLMHPPQDEVALETMGKAVLKNHG